jgi:integrase/recombinase XerD
MTSSATGATGAELAPVGDADPVLAAAAALPMPTDDAGQRWNLRTATAAWLRSRRSTHTRRAYFRDLADFLTWCAQAGLDPRAVRRGDVDAYVAARCEPLSPASAGRRLSTLSSWYAYLQSNEVTDRNPLDAVDRPPVDRDTSATVGLTGEQAAVFMRAARTRASRPARRDTALLGLLAELGLRVGEALALDLNALRHNRGHRTVMVTGKGGRRRELPIPAPLGRDLDGYLAERAAAAGVSVEELAGPLFVTATGKRVDQPAVFRLVRRVGRAAGLPNADQLSPHSLRHTVATAALDAGAALRDVQDLLGHADPRTTRRYDRGRGSLDRSPAYLIAGLFAHDDPAA